MRRAVLVAALASGLAAAASAQVPAALSPRLASVAARADTTVLVWVIARPSADLDALAAQVRALGGRVRHLSRFVHAVSAVVPSTVLAPLARRRDVRRVQPVGVYRREPERGEPPCGAGATPCPSTPARVAGAPLAPVDTTFGPGAWAAQMLGIPAVRALGARGQGVRVAILDGGFNTLHPYLAGARVVAQRDFVYDDSVVRDEADETPQGEMSHGTATWSLIGAQVAGRVLGGAPEAQFLLAKTEYGATETRIEEDHWVAAVEWAEALGVDIISSSLGYLTFDDGFHYTVDQLNGDLAVTTIAADSAARRGTLVIVSAGNGGAGPNGTGRTIGTPADADSVVAVGALDSLGHLASFSSRGPTGDGRTKPEVVAPGVAVTIAAMDTGLTRGNGTSYAAPLVAALAAAVQSTRAGRPAVELRRGLLAAASRRATPSDSLGWGVPDGLRLLAFPAGLEPLGPRDALLTTVTPTFSWRADHPDGFAPDTFRLLVATDPNFTQALLDTVTTATAVTLPFAAPPNQFLHWRFEAASPIGVRDSTPPLGPHRVPAWATLLTLAAAGGTTTRDSQPTFAWHAPAIAAGTGPFVFDVFVYPASGTPAQAVASVRGISDTTFRPSRPLEHSRPFRWRVVVRVGSDSSIVTSAGSFLVLDDAAPPVTLLFQNFPNPFPNAATGLSGTCIWFDLAEAGDVALDVFDLRGRRVARIAPSADVPQRLEPGHYGRPPGDLPGSCDPRFRWDGRDATGAYVRPGVYLYRLTAPGYRDVKRIVFLGAP